MKTTKYQLKNGLTVILAESRKSPVVSIQSWVRTGSADESDKEKGLSHFIEHLLFKGTEKFQPGEVAQIVEGSGGEFNAYTSFDQTVFYVTISKEFSERGLDVISQMVGYPSFIESEVDNEREVVIEEIKRGKDNPGRRLSQKLFSTLYTKHNYLHPVIGYDNIVKETPVDQIKEYYSARYTPKNMFLVVSGDFETEEMKTKVEKYFESIPAPPLRTVVRDSEPEQQEPRLSVEKSEFRETQGYVAWPVPGARDEDIPALDVLALILGQGDSSRIVKRVRINEHLVNSVGAMAYTPKDQGVFAISYTLNVEKMDEALSGFSEELIRILEEPPTIEELQKAITNLQSDEYYSLETVDGIARKMGMFEFLFEDPTFYEKYNEQILKLSPNDITEVARRYLLPEKVNLVAMSPEEESVIEGKLGKFSKDYAECYHKAVSQELAPSQAGSTPFVFVPRDSKMKDKSVDVVMVDDRLPVVISENSDSRLSSVKIAMPGGLLFESAAQAGLSELFCRSWTCGTDSRTEEQLNLEIENTAGNLYGFSGRNSIGLSFEALSCFEEKGGDLLFDVLTSAKFSDTAVARERATMMEQIKNKEDNAAQVCIHMFTETIFQGHPYERDVLGELKTLENLGTSELNQFLHRQVSPDSAVVALSGNVDRDHWLKRLEDWCKETPKASSNQFPSLSVEDTSTAHRYHHLAKEQSHMVVGFPALSLTSEKRPILSVLQAILAGQGGRLFMELRDKASLAYTVSPLRFEGVDRGYFGAYIGCSPDKVTKAYQMMKDEFAKMVEVAVSDPELDRAKNYLIGKHDIGLQRSSAIAYSILFDQLYGNPADSLYRYVDQIKSVTDQQIRDLAAEIFGGKEVRSLVGASNF